MKPKPVLGPDLDRLEQDLARDVAALAALLGPRPSERDHAAVTEAVSAVVSSRRRLASALKAASARDGAETREARERRDTLRKARDRLRLWSRFEAVLEEQHRAPRRGLMEEPPRSDRPPEVMDHVVAMFVDMLHTLANPRAFTQTEAASKSGHWADIPYPMASFARVLGAAYRVCLAQRRPRPLRFLDVGSGGGVKLLAATTCFHRCDGLEYDADAVRSGSRLLEVLAPETCRLFHGDALAFDRYGDYDVIYFFRPISETDRMAELEARILAQVAPGTVLAVTGGLVGAERHGDRVQRLADQIHVAGLSAEEAARLRGFAEEMGTTVPGHGRRAAVDFGYWQPLREACARNGYHV